MKLLKKVNHSLVRQCLIIMTAVLLFMTSACIDKRVLYQEHLVAFAVTAFGDILLLALWTWQLIVMFKTAYEDGDNLKYFLYRNRGVILALIFCFAIRVVQFGDTPRWDSLIYYRMLMSACQNFNFTLSQYLNDFAMASHPTLGYASLLAIGEFLFSGEYTGVLMMNMVLVLLAAFCTYRIFEKIMPGCSWKYITIGTCFVFSTPMVLGLFSYFQPDNGLAYALIFLLYSFLYQKNILMLFSMFLLIETKEVGILLLGGSVLGVFLNQLIWGKEKRLSKRFIAFFRQPLGFFCLIGGILGICLIIVKFKDGFRIWSYGNEFSEYMNTVSFIPEFFSFRIKQYFILNFAWMIWGSNLVFWILGILKSMSRKKRKKSEKLQRQVACAVFGAALTVMVFYSIYITFLLPRYVVIIEFCGDLLFIILLQKVFARKNIRYIWSLIIGVCVLVQSYFTIDPLSLAVFEHVSTGNAKIIMANVNNPGIQKDYCVYNHQFNYHDQVFNCVLRDTGYHEGMDVWIWRHDTNPQVWSNGIYWDTEKEKRVLVAGENTIEIRGFVQEGLDVTADLQLNSEAVFILMPQYGVDEEYVESFLNSYYEIRTQGTISVPLCGQVTYYVCDLIGEKVRLN